MTKDGLSELVTEYWPDLRLRLGNLLDAFCETVQAGAAGHQLRSDLAVARFCSLCCALGPNFERKPENEWALAILADERLAENVKVHQLVVRASAELKARQGAGHGLGDEILRADGKLLDATDAASRAASSDWVPVPRLSCDVEAVDIRLLEIDWRGEYQYLEGSWQWVAVVPESPSVRVTADVPAPPMVCILSHGPGKGAAARIQVRLLTHALCDHDRHPVVEFAGAHGLTRWHGHAARAVSWRVECLAPGLSTNAMGVALVEETLPATSLVRASACGLRDVGVPLGSVQTYLWVYPADQWLFALRRKPGGSMEWPRPADGTPQASPSTSATPTQVRIERDAGLVPSTSWVQAFDVQLERALLEGLDGLFDHWQKTVNQASMRASTDLLSGQAALTWGWREGPQGLAGRPLMRVAGELNLTNNVDWLLSGELQVGATRTRVRLLVHGQVPWQRHIARDSAGSGLADTLRALQVRWRLTYQMEFDPVAVNEGAVCSEVESCVGAVVGESGMRPRADGGGWQWYVQLESEPLNLTVWVHDPILGSGRKVVPLLPALRILDWSAG